MTNTFNTGLSYYGWEGTQRDLEIYDELPSCVRKALREAAVKFAAGSARDRLLSGRTENWVTQAILNQDIKGLCRTREKIWGPDYPVFNKGVRA